MFKKINFRNKYPFAFVLLIITILFVFKKFFLPGPLVWGDAPYFYKDGLKELFNFPFAWTSRGNTFGGGNFFIFIYPIMLIYGFLGTFLHLNNDLILRVLFYFPSIIFSFIGVYFFVRYLKFSSVVRFFSILVYLVNTYYLLIVDGGQVGVVLAYGLFPLVLYLFLKFIDKSNLKNFILVFLFTFVLTVVDFRISAICFLTAMLLKLLEPKKILKIFLVLISVVGISLYWIIPALELGGTIATGIAGLQTTSLLNSLFLFSPNWPSNQFGQTVAPYFYFGIIPVLIFSGVFLKNEKRIYFLSFVFLIFAFLAKGTTSPFGSVYYFFINTRIGSVFRDSTKFFIPLILIAGILIGIFVEEISSKIRSKNLRIIPFFLVYVLIFAMVWQVVVGRMNGVLGKDPDISSFIEISKLFSNDKQTFFRTAWFTEKSPFAYHTEKKQALDAKDLVNFRPFANMNVGTGDRFNFVNNSSYLDWFNLMGIKYLVFNGNPRVKSISSSDQKDWDRLQNLIINDSRLKKVNLGMDLPVYENVNIHPNKFFVDKAFVVVGPDDIYAKFEKIDSNFSVGNAGFLFVEDGKLDPSMLQNIASTSAILIFNGKSKEDLTMSFLQKYFVSPQNASSSEWSVFSSNDYLNYKYELLTRGLNFNDFDYNLGIALSTTKGEKINFSLDVPDDGDYVLAVRAMDIKGGSMQWELNDLSNLKKGKYSYTYENKSSLKVFNTVALIPLSEMKNAESLTTNFVGFFKNYNVEDKKDSLRLEPIIQNLKWRTIPDSFLTSGWIVFTDTFNSKWVIQKPNLEEFQGYPFYSMVNGFYVKPDLGQIKIIFNGNYDVRWGIYFSVISLITVSTFIIWKLSKK